MTRHLGRRLARLEKGAGMKRSVMLVVEKLDGLDVDAELAAQGRNVGPGEELMVIATGIYRDPAPGSGLPHDAQ